MLFSNDRFIAFIISSSQLLNIFAFIYHSMYDNSIYIKRIAYDKRAYAQDRYNSLCTEHLILRSSFASLYEVNLSPSF